MQVTQRMAAALEGMDGIRRHRVVPQALTAVQAVEVAEAWIRVMLPEMGEQVLSAGNMVGEAEALRGLVPLLPLAEQVVHTAWARLERAAVVVAVISPPPVALVGQVVWRVVAEVVVAERPLVDSRASVAGVRLAYTRLASQEEIVRTAVIVAESGLVENVIELAEDSAWSPPEGYTAVASETASPGDVYSGGNFTRPEPIVPPVDTVREAIADGSATHAQLVAYLQERDHLVQDDEQ